MKNASLNIAPFALPNTPLGEIRFEDPRDIAAVEAVFPGAVPEDVGLSYLQKTWPDARVEESADKATPATLGWAAQDDWFNGTWRKAAVTATRDGQCVRFAFQGLAAEFPALAAYDVGFRRTLGIRVDGPAEPAPARITAVYTTATPKRTRLHVELDAGCRTPGAAIAISGYNASVEAVAALSGVACAGTRVEPGAASESRHFSVDVAHSAPAHPYGWDSGLVTFTLEEGSGRDDAFTISLDALEREGSIWFADMGVFISSDEARDTFDEYRTRNQGAQTLNHRVHEHAEQTLAGAMNGQPRPHPVNFVLGCTHARQQFRVEPNGDIDLTSPAISRVPGKDTARVKSAGCARFFFGLERWGMPVRFRDPEPVMAYNLHARRGELLVEQKSFAVPLLTPITTGAWAGDDPMAALVRFRFRNAGEDSICASLTIRYSHASHRTENAYRHPNDFYGDLTPRSPMAPLTFTGNRLFSEWEGAPAFRCSVDADMELVPDEDSLTASRILGPGDICTLIVKIPYIAIDTAEEFGALDGLDFERCYTELREYWRGTAAGARVATPEPQLDALHAAHPAHVFVTDFAMPDDPDLVNTSVGTATYGNFTNESCMIVNELDRRGLHDEARRRLAVWLKYQGTVPQPGNFTDCEGMFYGAGGFEQGCYNQHHGWALWCLCEHFFLTHDSDWFDAVAGAVIAGADWVFRQRAATTGPLPHSRGWERGFLPAGSLEDVEDFFYWLSTNALTWRGAEWAARALERAGHPEAARIRAEADAYRTDLIRGFETMRRHAPLVRLRDGRWVPQYPSRLYRRGRDFGWIREVLEGSIYLLISGLYDPRSREGGWILDDFQDNRYPAPPYGYVIPHFEDTWFNLAGFSIQPNLLAGLMPHLERDEPEVYIWMFYNAWASCYREEIGAMTEHPLPWLGFSNAANIKTSDEANAVAWLRHMFVYAAESSAEPDTLHLGRAIPRHWFDQHAPFEAQGVVTRFGTAGIRYEPDPGRRVVKAVVSLELVDTPGRVLVRVRPPQHEPVTAARVDGAVHPVADPGRGDVDISGRSGRIEVEFTYG
ncbi:MAG: hypothetical protein JXR94_09235 [Candidatus Hydrogenedentes bacterium]|nr:hypothetical protein [Candidatus Hydrogenedentota bacterium]